ncbi:MAG: DUF4406 domain-containing protein [Oscillospiraceae bacterium]|nr:DUF4406 domain-containing protein [Oscillospiraceae bacterium]
MSRTEISRYNGERYSDPTAYAALSAVERDEYRKTHPRRPLVYVCSPFAGDEVFNTERARRFCKFAVEQGAIPFAPHLLYPQFMDDGDPGERELALLFGVVWLCKMDELWVFGEYISPGMKREIKKARAKGIPIKFFTADCEARTE